MYLNFDAKFSSEILELFLDYKINSSRFMYMSCSKHALKFSSNWIKYQENPTFF